MDGRVQLQGPILMLPEEPRLLGMPGALACGQLLHSVLDCSCDILTPTSGFYVTGVPAEHCERGVPTCAREGAIPGQPPSLAPRIPCCMAPVYSFLVLPVSNISALAYFSIAGLPST